MDINSRIEEHFRIQDSQKKALHRLGIYTIKDLLYHFPTRYGDTAEIRNIVNLQKGDNVTLFGRINKLKTSKAFIKKIPMATGELEDDTGAIKVVWFNQPYIAKMLKDGMLVRADGIVSERKGELYLNNPKMEPTNKVPIGVGESLFGDTSENYTLYPVYPESKGVTSNWMYHALQKAFKAGVLEKIEDDIPEEILKRYNLPSLATALIWMHAPKKQSDADAARKRFAFEEVFFIQLKKQKIKNSLAGEHAYVVETDRDYINKFTSRFPFKETEAQAKAIDQVCKDFKSGIPMARLLEGDVGSGKTAVAATTAYAIATTKPKGQDFGTLQVAYMAPTEILAKQLFDSFIKYFAHLPIQIGLLTGSGCKKFPSKIKPNEATDISRSQLLKWVAQGEIAILVGTHSLIQKSVKFKHLAYVIIDEQHRFGVNQRATLIRRSVAEATRSEDDVPPPQEDDTDPTYYKDQAYIIKRITDQLVKHLGVERTPQEYESALEEAFIKEKITYTRNPKIPVLTRNKKTGDFTPSFIVNNKYIVHIETKDAVDMKYKKEFTKHLKNASYFLGLVAFINKIDYKLHKVEYVPEKKILSESTQLPSVPHLLSMSATPIPRTLALTVYGDLDISILDQMPAGRKPVITDVVMPHDRKQTYEKIREEINNGRQAYIICPRIDEPDPDLEQKINAKSVTEEAARLKKEVFPEFNVGILHGKMSSDQKEKVMTDFEQNIINILVSTSVVEVGVNVPNATVIVIEGAERFGLAQLHQLRGRVIRGTHQAYCFIFAETKSDKTIERLSAFKKAKDGFELAEHDLGLRGSGELYSGKQWGLTDLAMEAIKNIKMVEAARGEAQKLLEEDPELTEYPHIKTRVEAENEIHFE